MTSQKSKSLPLNALTTLNNYENEELPSKRVKSNNCKDDIASLRRQNFIRACELVSQKAYCNYAERLQLIYMPVCVDRSSCVHTSTNSSIKEIPMRVTKLFKFEIEASNWMGALEVCILSITHNQYLSSVVLKDIVEIMLNAHEDLSSGYTITQVIDKCKLVLSLHFITHCPCLHDNVREVYYNFLTQAMDRKENTRTNRNRFGYDKGIVNFCLTRLEHELGHESTDSPLLDIIADTPEELRQTVKGMFYQKEQFTIFEMLNRAERINRLMAVLNNVIELLQFDLAIFQSIGNTDMKRKLRGKRILMAGVLQQYSNCNVTNICIQILRIFAYYVHLNYPDEHIKTMTLWLNAVMEYFYRNENRSNIDYPTPGKVCKPITNNLYDIIKEMPSKSILNIIETIKPAYLRYQISNHYCHILLSIDDDKEIFNILIDFLKEAKWNDFPRNDKNLLMLKNSKRVKPNKILQHLSKLIKNLSVNSNDNNYVLYPRLSPMDDSERDQSLEIVISVLYIALQSCLEAYGIQSVQETLQKLNENVISGFPAQGTVNCTNNKIEYATSETFIKKYRQIFHMLKELILTLKQVDSRNNPLTEMLRIFDKILELNLHS